MRVTLERSGGFAGIPLKVELDDARLSAERAARLHHLVGAAGLAELPSVVPPPERGADRFRYHVAVEDQADHYSVTVTDGTVPIALQPLLDFLLAAARSERGASGSGHNRRQEGRTA